MADESPAGGHLTLSCGPHGALSCGHSHSDELSFDLWTGGAPLFVDPGTCAYDGPPRNRFRSTSAHNTLELGGEGVSLPAGPFSWRRRVDAACKSWEDGGSSSRFEGYHDGYTHLSPAARHSRVIWRPARGLWLVEDTVGDAGTHEAIVRWHLSPRASLRPARNLVGAESNEWQHFEIDRQGVGEVSLLIHGARAAHVAPGEISPQYGLCVPSQCLEAIAPGPSVAFLAVIIDWSALQTDGLTICTSNGQVRLSGPRNAGHQPLNGPIGESATLDLAGGRRAWHEFGVPRTAP